MSHQIIYNRLFVKVIDKDNTPLYIPMVLSGSNNCTQINYSGREIRERSWYNSKFVTNDKILGTEISILKKIDDYRLELMERWKGDEDWAKYKDDSFGSFAAIRFTGKKYCSFNSFKNFYALGMKQALTVEQLQKENIYLRLFVSEYSHNKIKEKGLEVLPNITFTSSEMLLNKVKEYEEYYNGIDCLFVMYDDEYTITRYFSNLANNRTLKRITKEKTKIEVDFYFVLKNDNGFFAKNTKRGYKYLSYTQSSYVRKWETEKQANAFHKKMKNSEDWTVTKIMEKTTLFVTK